MSLRTKNARRISGALAILGGALILGSGVRLHAFILAAALFIYRNEGSVLPPDVATTLEIFILILIVLVILGGLLAVVGGFAMFGRHATAGMILIALGGGIGFAGIGFSMAYDIYAYGFSVLITRIDYWIGVLLASVARYAAKDAA